MAIDYPFGTIATGEAITGLQCARRTLGSCRYNAGRPKSLAGRRCLSYARLSPSRWRAIARISEQQAVSRGIQGAGVTGDARLQPEVRCGHITELSPEADATRRHFAGHRGATSL